MKRRIGDFSMLERVGRLSDGKQNDITGNLLLFSMFALETAYLYSASPVTLVICGILGILTYFYALKDDDTLLRFMFCIAAAVVALVTINRLFILNCGWSGCLRIVFISLPIAYLLYKVHISRLAALSFFYAVFIYTVIMIALADPAELYRIFAASSRNYISVLLIACLFPYYLACKEDHAEVSVFPALLSLTVSIYVQSRGGMVTSAILVSLTIIREIYSGIAKRAFQNRTKLIRFLISALLLSGIVFFAFSKPSVSAGFSENYLSRFHEPAEYPISRSDMWKEYITITLSSLKNIILGPPLTTCSLIKAEAYNSHNSYFMTHSYMGIAGFVAVLAGGIGYLVLCIRKKQYDLLFLSVAFLFRATTDYLFPILFCDCVILFMIMDACMAYVYEKRKNLNPCDSCV